MRRAIFISILLTTFGLAKAQERDGNAPVRLVFTSQFQQHPFGADPVWGGWPDGSMARAMSYIRSHRHAMGEGRFALLECAGELSSSYRLYPEDFSAQIRDYCGYETALTFSRSSLRFGIMHPEKPFDPLPDVRIALLADRENDLKKIAQKVGVDLAVVAFGREPEVCRVVNMAGDTITVVNLGTTGKYIGVADFMSADDFTVKTVDISGFPADAEYSEHFQSLSDSLRAYYNAPIATLDQTVRQSDALFQASAYAGLFHRFQLERAQADISFFAGPIRGDSIPAGGFTPRDLLRRFRYDNRLTVIELTGEEIVRYLEYTYGLRYNTMRRSTDDLFRLSRDRDGILRPRTAIYNLDEIGGACYEVNVSRPQGRRIRMGLLADGTPFEPARYYRVVMNSHRAHNGGGYLSRGTQLTEEELERRIVWESPQDYRVLLRDWFLEQPEIVPRNPDNWRAAPESFVEAAKKRFTY